MNEEDVIRAVEAAVRDHKRSAGSYYSGPGTAVYLEVRAILNKYDEGEVRKK
jgi:hypothetical protein